MNLFNQLRKSKIVAIRNFDEETYRLVKTYATLEDRTIASIFEEAVREWLRRRENYEEVMLWANLEKAYKENLRVFKESGLTEESQKGYALVCDGRLVGVFGSYEEVLENCRRSCRVHALIVKLPYREGEVVELGLPW